ncbi:MAG TPA: phospholipase D-like domain-containing protein [Gemmatimonadaceae bacterium]|nr:phospholipase D-like domain-containing protein [Gemmatimonadaceae bacterium]
MIFVIAIGLVALLAAIALLDATRGTPVARITSGGDPAPPAVADPVFLRTMEAYIDTPLRPGHAIEIFANGDQTYPRLWADIRAARRFAAVQMYYCKAGKVADAMRDALTDRARAGVETFFLYDAFGSSLKRDYLDSLRAAGVRVAKFRSLRPHMLHAAQHRAHVRAVVIDGAIGYTGGFGLDDKWLGDGRHEGQWRDTNVRFTGPPVVQLFATFGACWAEATGELITGERYFAPPGGGQAVPSHLDRDGPPPVAGLLHAAPTVGSTDAERFFALSIAGARHRLYITNPYFVPDDDFRRFVTEAAARGVDVRILTAGRKTDVRSTYFAARARYEELLKGGVRIFEYLPSTLHAKTMVVDGVWGTVGTMNADNRSMAFNNESNLVALDPSFAKALEQLFHEDLGHAEEVNLETFRRRPWYTRPLEQGAHLMSRIL